MSRCFPFPPPGYERNGTRDEALIESIKLQREREKERRKEKKGKKKENKEKARGNGDIKKKKYSHEKRHKDERSKVDQKGGDHQKKREDETEQLEKSGLTEEHEHGQQVSFQNLYDSSDSTQNSKKRKMHSSPSDGSHSHSEGSTVQIRLPVQKHKNPELLSNNEGSCSTFGRLHIVPQEKYEIVLRPSREQPSSTSRTKTVAQEIAPRPCKEQHCSTSGRTEILVQEKAETFPASSFFGSDSLQIESQFRDLMENWVPPLMQIGRTEFDDQEWLFETNKQHRHSVTKIFKARNDGSCNGNSSCWPSVCHLPEAELYVLPFTVPY
ncbi:hypothetical protein HHK36_031188 [Tetracentron sinense]|uniref:Uncharacterized protein n=1 Tax=Tetracentron sinense TaxID=13715 RepID=A0A835D2A3_TETSI|nr:hypothetical protein HHK36_031188 [Tetracentron sinense]